MDARAGSEVLRQLVSIRRPLDCPIPAALPVLPAHPEVAGSKSCSAEDGSSGIAASIAAGALLMTSAKSSVGALAHLRVADGVRAHRLRARRFQLPAAFARRLTCPALHDIAACALPLLTAHIPVCLRTCVLASASAGNQLCGAVQKASGKFDDLSVSPVIRQTLLHWAFELSAADYDAWRRSKSSSK